MEVGYHPPVEEYLEAIWSLEEEGIAVIAARIAERLGHAPASVSEMLERLVGDGYLERTGRVVMLTKAGREVAIKVIRKHRLAERLLVDVIGLEWHKVHSEAGRWEHVISDEVEARLVVLLGNPTTCPHGNPIPGARSVDEVPTQTQVPLSEAEPGMRIRLERVSEQVELDISALAYLDRHGFMPGATATVAERAPDGTLMLLVTEAKIAFGPELSRRLFVVAA